MNIGMNLMQITEMHIRIYFFLSVIRTKKKRKETLVFNNLLFTLKKNKVL